VHNQKKRVIAFMANAISAGFGENNVLIIALGNVIDEPCRQVVLDQKK
jgi:hypothetical protein